MLREGITFENFAAIARMTFVESAAKDFVGKSGRAKASASSLCALTGMSVEEINRALVDKERFETNNTDEILNPFARVLHGWHNDRDYVGPYGFPIDLPFEGAPFSFSRLTNRHAPGVSPSVVLKELKRIGAVSEVGTNVWKPLKQEYIEPNFSAENIRRMASLVESLLSTLENNTRRERDGTDLFERTMIPQEALTYRQLLELQAYMKLVGGQFLQRVDTFAAVELHEKMGARDGEVADIRAGLQCFLYAESPPDETKLRDVIDFNSDTN